MSLYGTEKFQYSYTPLKLMTFTAYIITRKGSKFTVQINYLQSYLSTHVIISCI